MSIPINKVTIGTCSQCGGPVTVPAVWHGVIQPTPTCEHCGAQQAGGYGPTIPTRQPGQQWASDGTGDPDPLNQQENSDERA